jgi:hypothetical protein
MAEEIKPALAYEQMPRNITECDHNFTEAYVDCDRCGSTKAFTQTIEEAVARMNALPRDASPAGS